MSRHRFNLSLQYNICDCHVSAHLFLSLVVQLCVDALDRLAGDGAGPVAPSVKIPDSAPIAIPGSPHTPSVLQPVAAIATLFNSREQRIQQQKERRERRKEAMKLKKSDSAAKGNIIPMRKRNIVCSMHLL